MVPPAGVLDAVMASARATASLQAQQFRWIAAFGRPGVAVPISAVLTALCNGPGVAFLGLPAEEDFEPGKAWEDTSVYGDRAWHAAVVEQAAKFAAAELAAALRMAPLTARTRLAVATDVVDRLPATLAALQSGQVDYGHVAAMVEATAYVDGDVCAQVEQRLITAGAPAAADEQPEPELDLDLGDAGDVDGGDADVDGGSPRPGPAASMTPGQLRKAAERAVIDLDPDAADRRAELARARRGVGVRGLGDDMSRLYADLLSSDAAVAFGLLDRLASDLPPESVAGRGVGQLRADIFADLFAHLATHGHIDLRGGAFDDADADADGNANAVDAQAPAPGETDCSDDLMADPGEAQAAPTAPTDQATPTAGGLDYEAWWTARTGTPVVLRPGFDCHLEVTVPLSTLAGLDDCAAELTGHGAITADLARALAAAFTKVTITPVPDPPPGTTSSSPPRTPRCDHPGCHDSPECGSELDRGQSRYQPPNAVAEHVRNRDRTCRFPGCAQPARRCDLDHRISWNDGGSTCPCDLDALCRTHHRLKTFTTWRAVRTDNTLTWTSPLGRTYIDAPLARPTGSHIDPDPPPF